MFKIEKSLVALAISLSLAACGGSDSNNTTDTAQQGTATTTPANNTNNSSTTEVEAQKVFQEFWDIFDRYYPLMHRKNIDWQKVHDAHFTNINSATTNAELVKIVDDIMQNQLKDGHTFASFGQQRIGYEPKFTDSQQRLQKMLANTSKLVNLLDNSGQNTYIRYGTLKSDSDIGYIEAVTFEPANDNDAEFEVIKSEVDKALLALENSKGMIIDVRANGGGQVPAAYYLAGRFATNSPQELVRERYKVTTGSTEASLSGWVTQDFDGFTDSRAEGGTIASSETQSNHFQATGDSQYANKVAVLTSKMSASATEYFTAAMKSQAHVRTIGDTTFGIFAGSELLTLNANKDWKVNLSVHDVEIKYKGEFTSFEGIGISPDETLYPTVQQVSAGEDVHIAAAIKYINGDSDTSTATPSPVTIAKGEDFTDPRDSQVYPTVKIGEQVWMAKNLNYELKDKSWHYNDDPKNGEVYGRLYLWEGIQEAIPQGWHIATDEEWKTLERNLGMSEADLNKSGYDVKRGTDQGKQLQVNGKSLMNIPLSGFRHEGEFHTLGERTYLWVNTTIDGEEGPSLYRRRLVQGDPTIYRFTNPASTFTNSVRLIKD